MESFEEDLQRVEEGLRLLQAEYNRFFIGSSDFPPNLLHSEIKGVVQRLTQIVSNLRPGERFRVNGAISRYQVLSQLWLRTVRQIEEGQATPLTARSRDRQAAPAEPPERELFRTCITAGDSLPEPTGIRTLYDTYLEASRNGSGGPPDVSYPRFCEQVLARAGRVMERTGSESVLLRVVLVDNRPVLKIKSGT